MGTVAFEAGWGLKACWRAESKENSNKTNWNWSLSLEDTEGTIMQSELSQTEKDTYGMAPLMPGIYKNKTRTTTKTSS